MVASSVIPWCSRDIGRKGGGGGVEVNLNFIGHIINIKYKDSDNIFHSDPGEFVQAHVPH